MGIIVGCFLLKAVRCLFWLTYRFHAVQYIILYSLGCRVRVSDK